MKKEGSIQIHDAKKSKKNPNAMYEVKCLAPNSEPLQDGETVNDEKAVRTHIKSMAALWKTPDISLLNIIDFTKGQKFCKPGARRIAKPAK
jgi:hypothetical protein